MELHVSSKFLVGAVFLATVTTNQAFSSPCLGQGTVVFFGNGMFNTKEDAKKSLEHLFEHLRTSDFNDSTKPIVTDLAYKRSEPVLEQLANVAKQKGVTEFENFWAWLASLQRAPTWFIDDIKIKSAELSQSGSMNFTGLKAHFEAYSKYIRKGYNVILVSHSQGNLYANQVMRKLADYTDASLTGSIQEKKKRNPLFPDFSDLFANIQVATPVSETIQNSPWLTFKDDLIMAMVRETVGALPANLQNSGVGTPPEGDLFGHNFIKSYLRVDESRQKIISSVKSAYAKLRYPIAYFQPAIVVEHTSNVRDPGGEHLDFRIAGSGGEEVGSYDEEGLSADLQLQKKLVDCFKLRAGDFKITAESVVDHHKSYNFKYTVWPEGGIDRTKEKPTEVEFRAAHGIRRWDVGVIRVKQGSGKEPIEVSTEIYPTPKPRS